MTQQLESHPRSHSDSGKLVEDFFKVLGIFRRGWRFVAISVAICLALAIIYLARSKPTYMASARLLVLQKGGQPLNLSGNAAFNVSHETSDSLMTQVMIIRSYMIVKGAVDSLKDELPGLAADSVVKRLVVTIPESAARGIDIAYTTTNKGEAAPVIRAIIKSYNAFLREKYNTNFKDAIELIVTARDQLRGELKDLEEEFLKFRKENPSFASGENGPTLTVRRFEQLGEMANRMKLRELELRTQRGLAEDLAGEGLGIRAITNALKNVGGLVDMDEKPDTEHAAAGVNASPSLSYESVSEELNGVEYKRSMTARLVVHLRAALESSARPIQDAEVIRAFYADPAVFALQAELKSAEARHDEHSRKIRNAGDPVVRAALSRVGGLKKDLLGMWERRKAQIEAQLTHEAMPEGRAAIRKAEAELVELRARESALREKREEFRSDLLRRHRAEYEQVAKQQGPGVAAKVAQLGEKIAKLEGGKGKEADPLGDGPSKALLGSLSRSLGSLEALRQEIQKQFDEDRADAHKSDVTQIEESNLRSKLERHRLMFNSVVDQLKQVEIVKDYNSVTAQTINDPAVATLQSKMALILLMALVAGCGLGGGAAFVVDLVDTRIRTLSELRRALGYYVIGLIPQLPPGQQELAGEVGLISHTLPRSTLSESYKSVRTNLEFLRRNGDVRVLLVTSAVSGDGKSTTASNLAISLAHAGRKVLLIDGDLRRPSLHKIFALRQDSGLTQVLKGLLPLQGAIQPTLVENLDLLAAGPDVSNPAELLTSHRLGEVMAETRRLYDVVLFDSSPLLAVADPSVLAVAADRILLVVRVAATRRQDIDRIEELLTTLGTPVIGAVINAITQGQAGYGYQHGYAGYGSQGATREIEDSESGIHASLTNGRHEMTG